MQTRNSSLRDYWRSRTGSGGPSGKVASFPSRGGQAEGSSQGDPRTGDPRNGDPRNGDTSNGMLNRLEALFAGFAAKSNSGARGDDDNRGMKRAMAISLVLHLIFLSLVPTFPRAEEKPETFIEVEVFAAAVEKKDDGATTPAKMNKARDNRVKRSNRAKRSKATAKSKLANTRKSSPRKPAEAQKGLPINASPARAVETPAAKVQVENAVQPAKAPVTAAESKPARPILAEKTPEPIKPVEPVIAVTEPKVADAPKSPSKDTPVQASSDSGLKVPKRQTVSMDIEALNTPSDVKVNLRDVEMTAARPNAEVKTGTPSETFAQAARVPKPKKSVETPFETAVRRTLPMMDDLLEPSAVSSQRRIEFSEPTAPDAKRRDFASIEFPTSAAVRPGADDRIGNPGSERSDLVNPESRRGADLPKGPLEGFQANEKRIMASQDGPSLDDGDNEDARNVDEIGSRAFGQVEEDSSGDGNSSGVQADIEMSIIDKGKGKYSDPRLLAYSPPRYPVWAEKRGLFGKVTLKILVDDLGTVTDSVIIGSSVGDRRLAETARRSSLKWKFARILLDGKAVPAAIRMVVDFKLN